MCVVPADTVLTPRPKDIPAWDALSADEKKVYARMMEVYAAAGAQSDYEIGRVLGSLEQSGQLNNTLVIYTEGDNGAGGEGTLQGTTNEMGGNLEPESLAFKLSMIDQLGSDQTYNHYPVGVDPRDGHALSVDQAGGIALRRNAERHGHQLAEGD